MVGEKKVLLVCSRGQYSAVGSQCSHYNAPLVKGKTSVKSFAPKFIRVDFHCASNQEHWLVSE